MCKRGRVDYWWVFAINKIVTIRSVLNRDYEIDEFAEANTDDSNAKWYASTAILVLVFYHFK